MLAARWLSSCQRSTHSNETLQQAHQTQVAVRNIKHLTKAIVTSICYNSLFAIFTTKSLTVTVTLNLALTLTVTLTLKPGFHSNAMCVHVRVISAMYCSCREVTVLLCQCLFFLTISGDITQKGYEKKRLKLLSPYLSGQKAPGNWTNSSHSCILWWKELPRLKS